MAPKNQALFIQVGKTYHTLFGVDFWLFPKICPKVRACSFNNLIFKDKYQWKEKNAMRMRSSRKKKKERHRNIGTKMKGKEAQKKNSTYDSVIVASGTIERKKVTVAIFDFNFMGGSMGMAAG